MDIRGKLSAIFLVDLMDIIGIIDILDIIGIIDILDIIGVMEIIGITGIIGIIHYQMPIFERTSSHKNFLTRYSQMPYQEHKRYLEGEGDMCTRWASI